MRHRLAMVAAMAALAFLPAAGAQSADLRQRLKTDGLEIYYGIVPASVVLEHSKDHPERTMHGRVPRRAGQHHIMVSLFDARTSERLEDAQVWATVTELGLAPNRKKLEPMRIAGEMGYGNYFSMAAPGPYRIKLDIVRPAGRSTAEFEYFHPRQ